MNRFELSSCTVRMRRPLFGLIVMPLLAACATYHAAPLPGRDAIAHPAPLDLPRLRVAAAELRHPLLAPITLDLAHGLDPDQAAVLAVLLNPQLRAERDAHGEAEAQLVVAGLLRNPDFSFEATHPSSSDPTPLVNTLAASLAFDLQSLRTRGAKRAAAQAELAQVDLGIAWHEWVVAQDARLLTVRLAWLRRRLDIVRTELSFQDETEKFLERAVAAGDATLPQLGVQRASLETVRREANGLEQAQSESENVLLALLGRPPGLRLDVAPVPAAAAPVAHAAAPDMAACLDRRLDLDALRRGYEAQEARLRLAVLEQFPALTIGISRQRNESSVRFLGGFVSLALPIFDRGRSGVALADATRTRLRHEFDARAAAARDEIAGTGAMIALLERQIPTVRASLAPLASIEERERAAAARGDVDRLAYQTVRSSLLDQRLQDAALSQALAEAHVALDAACPGAVRAAATKGGSGQ
ncbi:MAG: TolC family protein [Acidobacteria bacterium]|nr:MAG: TolC family protein [Acidobacteriota bacterium]